MNVNGTRPGPALDADMAPEQPHADARTHALWARLRARDPSLRQTPPAADDMPWYLAALLGVSAWIAAGFLFGFTFTLLGDNSDEPVPVGVLGIFACVLGLALMRPRHGRAFAEQFGIACSLVGQTLCSVALYLALRDLLQSGYQTASSLSWLGLAAISVAMAMAVPSRLHRFLCGVLTAGGIAASGYSISIHHIGPTVLQLLVAPLIAGTTLWLWLRTACPGEPGARADRGLAPAAWAFSLVAMATLWIGTDDIARDCRPDCHPELMTAAFWLASLAVVTLLPLCVARLARGSAARWRRVGEAAVFALLVVGAPGVAFGLMLVLLGFALHRPVLLGVGLLGVAVYLVHYYYQLDVPLLQKSGWLLAGGAALLLARMVWRRSAPEEAA